MKEQREVPGVHCEERLELRRPKHGYTPRGDDLIQAVAEGLLAGEIFTDRDCSSIEEVRRVFKPLAAMSKEQMLATLSDEHELGLIYEYIEKAEEQWVNGKPTFMSMAILDVDDLNKVVAAMKRIVAEQG